MFVLNPNQFAELLRKMPKALRGGVVQGLQNAGLHLERDVVVEIERKKVVDTGELKQSVTTTKTKNGAIVSVNAPHAAVMEYGARPFTPPFAPILAWVKRKQLLPIGPRTTPQPAKLRPGASGPVFRERAYVKNREEEDQKQIAWAIVNKIKREGIQPRGYFAAALQLLPSYLDDEIDAALAALVVK